MPEGLLCRRDFTSHFLWSADKGSSSAGPFLEQLSKLWRKLGALDKLKHKTEVVDRRRDVRPEACQLVPRERAPAYLKRPFILSGYLIGMLHDFCDAPSTCKVCLSRTFYMSMIILISCERHSIDLSAGSARFCMISDSCMLNRHLLEDAAFPCRWNILGSSLEDELRMEQ